MTNTEIHPINQIRDIIAAIAVQYGLSCVWIFGSYAKGNANPQSDVDILVRTEDVVGGFKLVDVKFAFEEALGKCVDIVTTGSIKGSLLDGLDLGEVMIYSA